MYICICNAVNESTIKAAIAKGATTLRELSAATGVATTCGKCAGEAMRILQQAGETTLQSPATANEQCFSVPTLTVVA
ncbi:MAG: (2Fe-2S)-binding protein [Proteobacteria bacterium]|nr:(2Fe-2S)-binding protein [Pseudomonadota bacterium]